MHRLLLPAACLITAYAAEASWMEQYAAESAAANQTCAAKDYAGCRPHLATLLTLLDGRADIVYRLARVDAALGNRTEALKGLATFAGMKLPFADPQAEPAFADLRSAPEFADVVARLHAAQSPVSTSRPVLTLPEKDLVSEDIAYDPTADCFYVSSVRHGKILRVAKNGTTTEFLREGGADIWAVLALGVDSKRQYLWATTVAMAENLHFQAADRGRSALLRFSLRDGTLLKRYDLPRDTEHALGDLTLSPSGDVYISDGHGPVYWVAHDDDRLQALIPAGTFRSPQTPALNADGKTLFVPDYTRGISAVDLRTSESKLIPHPRELSLAGIDGLYLAGRSLIAVQNGTSPARIIRMQLDSSLARIESFEVLESNSPELGAPTHGVVVGDRFYFLANSGWDRLSDDGQVKPGATFEAPSIRELTITRTAVPR
jgi:hypothetical protein